MIRKFIVYLFELLGNP